jgi:hypothetical protein
LQVAACAFRGWHVPLASQYAVAEQAASDAQVVGHAGLVPSQRYGEHDGVPGVWTSAGPHVPSAGDPRAAEQTSHALPHAVLQQTPFTQKPLAQAAAPPGHDWPALSLQTPLASQLLFPVHVSGSSALVTAAQAPVPATHSVHVAGLQAEVQQTPLLQMPDTHSVGIVHVPPPTTGA